MHDVPTLYGKTLGGETWAEGDAVWVRKLGAETGGWMGVWCIGKKMPKHRGWVMLLMETPL